MRCLGLSEYTRRKKHEHEALVSLATPFWGIATLGLQNKLGLDVENGLSRSTSCYAVDVTSDPKFDSLMDMTMQIVVETKISAPIDAVWRAYTTPSDIMHWNAASDDWHTTAAEVDLREGGKFSSRMEAKDGSFGFDFAGTYTRIITNELIEYAFGDRIAKIEFIQDATEVKVRVSFDPESTHSIDQQRDGWQAILNRFARYVQTGC